MSSSYINRFFKYLREPTVIVLLIATALTTLELYFYACVIPEQDLENVVKRDAELLKVVHLLNQEQSMNHSPYKV